MVFKHWMEEHTLNSVPALTISFVFSVLILSGESCLPRFLRKQAEGLVCSEASGWVFNHSVIKFTLFHFRVKFISIFMKMTHCQVSVHTQIHLSLNLLKLLQFQVSLYSSLIRRYLHPKPEEQQN